MPENRFYPLSAITKRIQEILQPHMGKRFWVRAEISSGRERGGSFYCDLVETDQNGVVIAQLRCSIWQKDLETIRKRFKDCDLDLKLDDGTAVGFQCALQYHPRFGLSLKVVDADPVFALGELELKKKEILDRLIKEGLLKPNKALFVPMLPLRIGLISSKGSAAYSDVLKTLSSSGFGFRIYVADAVVQGNNTEQSVITALDVLEKLTVELVLIVRGGGSKTDLFYLDNEAIARRIAAYTIPVWTGIGHETDMGILDHVANQSFKTPTAVAEEIVARFIDTGRHLEEARDRFKSTWTYRLEMDRRWLNEARTGIRQGTRKLLDATKTDLRNMANGLRSMVFDRLANETGKLSVSRKIISTAPLNMVYLFQERLDNRRHRHVSAANRYVTEERNRLENLQKRFHPDRFFQRIEREMIQLNNCRTQLEKRFHAGLTMKHQGLGYLKSRFRQPLVLSRIENEKRLIKNRLSTLRAADPRTSLKRGFSLVYRQDGDLIKSIGQIEKDSMIRTDLSDGQVMSTVNSIKEK